MAGTSARWRALALSALLAGSTAATIAQPPASQAATLPPGFTETPVSEVFAPTTIRPG